MSNWKSFKILDEAICFKVCYGETVKRLDIRAMIHNLPSTFGVSLTPSEFKYIYGYYKSFKEGPLEVHHYDISIRKYSKTSFEIMKNGKKVVTQLSFWEKITPYIPLALYLVSQEIAVDQFIDIYVLSFFMGKDHMLKKQWTATQCLYIDPDNSIVYQLGLAAHDDFTSRKVDIESLNRFTESNPDVFESLIQFMYK